MKHAMYISLRYRTLRRLTQPHSTISASNTSLIFFLTFGVPLDIKLQGIKHVQLERRSINGISSELLINPASLMGFDVVEP